MQAPQQQRHAAHKIKQDNRSHRAKKLLQAHLGPSAEAHNPKNTIEWRCRQITVPAAVSAVRHSPASKKQDAWAILRCDFRERLLVRQDESYAMALQQSFDLDALELALNQLGRRCYERGRTVEIAIYGGSALLLTLNRQVSTTDVDAVFEHDKDFVKKLVVEMAEEFDWDQNWLNDGVKGWLSSIDADPRVKALFKTYPSEEQPGLRVFVAKPEYLFAMKCRAMRLGGTDSSTDLDDIKLLARKIGITSSNEALALVEKFYPNNILEPKTRFGLEEIFSSFENGRSDESGAASEP